jgi:hypothetical protein
VSSLSRTTLGIAAALVAATAVAATALAGRGESKVTVCHVTGSGMHQITIAQPAVEAHMRHGDFMPDEYGDC